MLPSSVSSVLASVILFAGTGCMIEATQTTPDPGQGSVEIAWTINRGHDPNQCAQGVVDAIVIDISDSAGRPVGSHGAVCEAFVTHIELTSGNYTANATLVDGAGRSRTTTIVLDPFAVRRGTVLQIPLDFSANSFL
jgi:hypothetical protein